MSKPPDPGSVLIDLLGFADAVAAGQPPRRFQPLEFPALAKLATRHASHGTAAGASRS